MTIGQIFTFLLLGSLLLMCLLVKLFPENPKKTKRVKKLYYARDYQGRFTAASHKKFEPVGGRHKYVVNI